MAIARISLSVVDPTTIHAGEIIYLQQKTGTSKSLIDHYDLYENHTGEPGGSGGPSFQSVGPRVGDSTTPTQRAAGTQAGMHHAMPVLVATGAEYHRGHGEKQFISMFVYGQCHLSAEKSDLHPPEDISINEQMYVEYDPNICRGVVCRGPGGSPFCKAVLGVPDFHERADTTVYLTPLALFSTPVADRDAIDGEEAPNLRDLYNTAYETEGMRGEGRTTTMEALRQEYGENLRPLLLEASRLYNNDEIDAIDASGVRNEEVKRRKGRLEKQRRKYEERVKRDPTLDDYDSYINEVFILFLCCQNDSVFPVPQRWNIHGRATCSKEPTRSPSSLVEALEYKL